MTTYLSVCSGIEAATVAWHSLGWQPVAFSEIERFPSKVLAHHYPHVPNLGDFTAIDVARLGPVDVLVGGTPCQAFSLAGLRQSLADARGNLTLAFVRLAHELADRNGLRNAVWENVPGVLSTPDNAFGCFLGGLVGADAALLNPDGGTWPNQGMVEGPRARAAWRILDAQHFELAQRRNRVFVVADFGNGADPAAVLFERASLQRNPAPRKQAGEGSARGFEVGTAGGRFTEIAPTIDTRAKDGPRRNQLGVGVLAFGGNNTRGPIDVATALAAHGVPHGRQDFASETFIACLTGEDGAGRGYQRPTPMAFMSNASAGFMSVGDNLSPTLRIGGCGGNGMAVAFDTTQITSKTNRSNPQPGDPCHPLAASAHPPALASTSAVRRLTPMECERLQGFPDGYTNIPISRHKAKKVTKNRPDDRWRQDGDGWLLMTPDGPRYKALGNSMAVPVMAWIGRRIAALLPPTAANDNMVPHHNAA